MHIHFIGVDDVIISSLAVAIHNNGDFVSVSDEKISGRAKEILQQSNLLPESYGWFPNNITTDIDTIVLGVTIKRNNPELLKAQELNIQVYSYPEFIYEQNRHKTRVVIGGSYGKTTITSMILHVMDYHNKEVDYVTKAHLPNQKNSVKFSENAEFIVIEGDEYVSSVLDARPKLHHYKPILALLSGLEWNYTNIYPTEESYNEQFKVFIDSIISGGILMYNEEDEILSEMVIASENPIRKMPYQTPEYTVDAQDTYLLTSDGEMPLEIFGKHNLSNLSGAKWICQHMGVDEEDFYEAISDFKGVPNRLEKIKSSQAGILFKDVANTPEKVKSSLLAVKEMYPNKEITVCLELHTFSSLEAEFLRRFQKALASANEKVLFVNSEKHEIISSKEAEILEIFKDENLEFFKEEIEFQSYLRRKQGSSQILLLMMSDDFLSNSDIFN